MERSDSVQRARTDSQYEPPGTTTPTAEAIAGKLTYGTTVSTATATPTTPRDSVIARQTTHNGMSAMIFKAKDYYEIMAEECKLTIAGRFLKLRPQIERLRSSFRELFSIKGAAKIGVNDNYNIFIDFNNEDDFNSIWYGRVIEIEGLQMWLQKWSLDIKPDEDIPIVLVWVLLPGIPFNMHKWHYVKKIVSNVGTPLALDVATHGRTRPSIVKVRVEIDLTKPLPSSVWVGS